MGPCPVPSAWPWLTCWPGTPPAPPTFLAKFLLGWSTAFAAQHLCHLDSLTDDGAKLKAVTVAAIFGSVVNVVSEPLIRFSFKFFILGLPRQVAYISALNCAVSMAISNVVSVVLTVILYKVLSYDKIKTYLSYISPQPPRRTERRIDMSFFHFIEKSFHWEEGSIKEFEKLGIQPPPLRGIHFYSFSLAKEDGAGIDSLF